MELHAEKTCPDCAESIKADARVCRFCGYRFDGLNPSGATSATAHAAQAQGTNGLAIASFVLGLVTLGGLGSILAIVFGYIALGQIDKPGNTQSGRGLAIAGIILGLLVLAVLVSLLFLLALASSG